MADLPPDQRPEDGRSLTFTSAPLTETMEILGFPEVTLTLAVDRPQALVAVRLCDVSPAGSSTLVSRGLLNLTHRESHEHPTPLEPGKQYTVVVRLNGVGYSLPAGHRWRVAVSPTYWPWAWPSPEPVVLRLFGSEKSKLVLPVRPPQADDALLTPFAEPEGAAPLQVEVLGSANRTYTVQHDVVRNAFQIVDSRNTGHKRIAANGIDQDSSIANIYTIVEGDPLSARVQSNRMIHVGRGEWQIRIETVSTMTADADNFLMVNSLEAYESGRRVFVKSWSTSIPRDLL
jgi:hypothetical protein